MGHHIEAFIFEDTMADAIRRELSSANFVALWRHLVLMPATGAVYDRLHELFPETQAVVGEVGWKYPLLTGVGTMLSRHGRIAYIETDYFGGNGDQGAVAWSNEQLIMAPVRGRRGPIDRALALLGVQRVWGQDEFATTGLDRLRYMDDWEEFEEPANDEI